MKASWRRRQQRRREKEVSRPPPGPSPPPADEWLQPWIERVEDDPECTQLSEDLQSYAEMQVRKYKKEIEDNLGDKFTVDLLWPGTGYNSVACGGTIPTFAHPSELGVLDGVWFAFCVDLAFTYLFWFVPFIPLGGTL